MVPGHDRWMGGEAGWEGGAPKGSASCLWNKAQKLKQSHKDSDLFQAAAQMCIGVRTGAKQYLSKSGH